MPPNPIRVPRMGASYRFPPNWQFTPQPRLFACGFFQPIASPAAPVPHRIPAPVWFLNRRPTHLHAEHLEKKKGRIPKDGDSQNPSKLTRVLQASQIQRIGTRPAGCATSVRSADARTRKTWKNFGKTWDCERRLTDLAVNFPGRHTRARPKGGQHAAAGTVRSGDSERSSRERGGHPARCAVPGASGASRGAAPSTRESAVGFSQSSDVAGRRATMASSSPADVHVLLVDDDRVCRTLVAGMLKKCNYQGEPRDSPRARANSRASTRRTT